MNKYLLTDIVFSVENRTEKIGSIYSISINFHFIPELIFLEIRKRIQELNPQESDLELPYFWDQPVGSLYIIFIPVHFPEQGLFFQLQPVQEEKNEYCRNAE